MVLDIGVVLDTFPASTALGGGGGRCVGDLFARLADPRDRLADRRLSGLEGDLQQHPGEVGLDLLGHLVGVDLEERLALLDQSPLRP